MLNENASTKRAKGLFQIGKGKHATEDATSVKAIESLKKRIADYVAVTTRDKTIGPIIGKLSSRDGGKEKEEFLSIPSGSAKNEHGERYAGASNQHVMVMGPSECGRTYSYVVPNIYGSISRGESFVVTDMHGELYANTAAYAEKQGYEVKVLNTNACANSDSVDFIGEMMKSMEHIDSLVHSLAEGIIKNTVSSNSNEDIATIAAEDRLLLALLYYIIYEMPESKKKLASVIELLDKSDDMLSALFETATADMPKQPWMTYYGGSAAFRGNVRVSLARRLALLREDNIKAITGTKDIDMTLPSEKKCAYYIILDDTQNNTNGKHFIEVMFIEIMLSCIMRNRFYNESMGTPLPVNMFLNGFCNLGIFDELDRKLAMVRSAEVNISILAPSLLELSKMYPNGWETMFANCSTSVLYKHDDDIETGFLKKYTQSRMGREILNLGVEIFGGNTITTSDLLTMPKDKCLVVLNGGDAFYADALSVTDFPEHATAGQKDINEHYPLWRRQRDAIAQESLNREKEATEKRNRKDKEQTSSRTLGDRIRELRTKNNWTQADLAERIGVTQQSVGNWEKGKRMPDATAFLALCEQFNIDKEEFSQLVVNATEDRLERLRTGATDGFSDIGIVDAATAMQWSIEFAKKHFGNFENYQIEIAARMLTFAMITGILFDPAIEWWRDGLSNVVDIYGGVVSERCDVFKKLTENRFAEVNSHLIIGKGARHTLEDDVGAHDVERLVSIAMSSFSKCSNDTKRFVGETLPSMLMAEATEVLATSDGYSSRSPTIKAMLAVDMCGGYLYLQPADFLYRYTSISEREETSIDVDFIDADENEERRDNREIRVSRIEVPLGARYHVLSLLDGAFPIRKGYSFVGWATSPDSDECLFSALDTKSQSLTENYEAKVLAPLMAHMHGRYGRLYAKWTPSKDEAKG